MDELAMGALTVWLALLGKESRALLPHWLGMVTLVTLFGVLQLFGDSLTLMGVSERVSGGDSAVLTVFLLAFACGHAMLGPEFFSRHIEFLDGLPVRRWQLYVAKVVASALPSVVTLALSLGWDLGSSWLSPGSLGASPYDEVLFAHALLGVGALAGLGCGLLTSWVGSLAWGIVLLGLVGGAFGSIIVAPIRPYVIAFGSFASLEFIGSTATHPIGPVLFWVLVSLVCIALSGLLFLGPGGSLTQRGSLATGAVRVGTVGCLSLGLVGLAALCLLVMAIQLPQLLKPMVVESTENFRVLYDPDFADQVHEATADVDALSAAIGTEVGNPNPVRLDLEFLGATPNHAGMFTGGKIRLLRDADREVVAHELVHAHAFAVSGPAAWKQRGHTRFFDEGLASWVAAQMEGTPSVPRVAAAIHALDPVEFDLLVEDEQWTLERDIAQPYPLGVVFVEALDQVGGVTTRSCILREIGAVGSTDTAGLALWVGIADRCGFVLEDVITRFETLLEDEATRLPALPEVEAYVDGTDLVVVGGDSPFALMCRFRSYPDAEVGTYEHVRVRDGRCALPLWNLSNLTFDYQVGFDLDDETVFDRWVTAPTP